MKFIFFLMVVLAGLWVLAEVFKPKNPTQRRKPFQPKREPAAQKQKVINGTPDAGFFEKGWNENRNAFRGLLETERPKRRRSYRDKFNLLNGAERSLYFTLTNAMPKMIVLSQVSMSQMFHIRGSDGYMQLGEVGRKSVDFLVCRKDFSVVAAIELNGPTHAEAKQRKSDETKKRALEEAGIPLIVFEPWSMPSVQTIRHEVALAIVKRRKYEEERNARLQRRGLGG